MKSIALRLLLAISTMWFTSRTDNFGYTTSDIATTGNWTCSETNGIAANGTEIYNNAIVNNSQFCYWSADSWANDHTSTVTLVNHPVGVFSSQGPTVRMTGTNFSNMTGYVGDFDIFNATWGIYKLSAGGSYGSALASGSYTATAGDLFKLDVTGSTLTLYLNGTALSPTASDGSYTTGSPGVWYYSGGTAAAAHMDTWIGDPISGGGGGPTMNPALLNLVPLHCCLLTPWRMH